MATNQTLKNQIAKRQNASAKKVDPNSLGLKTLLSAPTMKKKFEEVLDDKAPQFMSSLLNLYNGDPNLQKAEPMSIVSSAMVAAALDLPVDKNLGYAWIVPYYDSKKKQTVAQFQMGYKGYIQLALRTGQYKNINALEVHEGELISWNPLTEEIELDFEKRKSDKVIGYTGYFKLINGFEKTVYWPKEKVEAHRQRFSKSGFAWKDNYDAMAKKTVLRNMLSQWGILSIDMQTAYAKDIEDPEEAPEEQPDIVDADFEEIEEEGQSEEKAEKTEQVAIVIEDE